MSMFVFGDIVLCQCPKNIEQIATEISTSALSLGLYVKFGGNVSNQYIRIAGMDEFSLPFEITDSIVDNTATLLFAPQCTEIYADRDRIPNRPWADRIHLITSLLDYIVTRADVCKVILNIGVPTLFDISENTRIIMRQDLPSFFTQLYTEEDDIRASIHIVK